MKRRPIATGIVIAKASPKVKKPIDLGTPVLDRVIIEEAPAEEMTAGGIYIPDASQERPERGIVVGVGAGKKDEPMTVKIGDTVLYGKYAGTEVTIKGGKYLIMREADILVILPKN